MGAPRLGRGVIAVMPFPFSSYGSLSHLEFISWEPLINVGEAGVARQKWPKKRSLHVVNEHFEVIFNDVTTTQVVN